MDIIPISEWLPSKQQGKPMIVAGPCSAESETQILSVAQTLAESRGVHLLRAGFGNPEHGQIHLKVWAKKRCLGS